jgi:O-antigen/teichoic acid export membrane protein
VVAVFAPAILRIALGEGYVGAAGLVRILIWSVVLSALTAPLVAGLAGIGRAPDATKVFATAFVTVMIAHVSLDWWWGATGAAIATLSREPVVLGVALLLSMRAGLLSEHRDVEPQLSVPLPVAWPPATPNRAL